MGDAGDGSGATMKEKFDELKRVKVETERTEKDREETEKSKYDEHEQVVSVDPREFANGSLSYWWPEDAQFWKHWGKSVGQPNVNWSLFSVFVMSAVWYQWVEIARILESQRAANADVYEGWGTGDEFSNTVNSIPQAAFLGGSMMRVVNAFMTNTVGGRAAIFMNLVILLVPMLGICVFLSFSQIPSIVVVILAVLSSVGFGGSASCLAHAITVLPQKEFGSVCGLLYECIFCGMAFGSGTAPLVAAFGICSAGADGTCQTNPIGESFPFNLGLWFSIFIIAVIPLAKIKLFSAPGHSSGSFSTDVKRWFVVTLCGLIPAIILGIVWSQLTGLEAVVCVIMALVLSLVGLGLALFCITYLTGAAVKERIHPQLAILRDMQGWRLIFLHTLAGGTLLIFADAFPKVAATVFAEQSGDPQSHAPLPFVAAGIGCIIGGRLSDRSGGSTWTLWGFIIQAFLSIFGGLFIMMALGNDASDRDGMFYAFYAVMYFYFFFSGITSASTLRQISVLVSELRGPVLGLATAVSGFVFFFFCVLIVKAGEDNFVYVYIFVGLLLFVGAFVNFWFFHRAKAENPC
jgi:nitrate/nitrite transporter NarK